MKIALVCCAKHEENYIREFIEYYKFLGIDKIFIADNNESFYKIQLSAIIADHIENGFVEIYDYHDQERIQARCYKKIYNDHKTEYDWFCMFDVDEFLQLEEKEKEEQQKKTFKDYLNNKILDNYNSIVIPWKIYDDNDLIYYDSRLLTERFTRCSSKQTNEFKSIYRGNLDIDISIHYGHDGKNDKIRISDIFGNDNIVNIYNDAQGKERRSIKNISDKVFLKHFKFKTVEEYINNKITKGNATSNEKNFWLTQKTDNYLIDTFFKFNKKTVEKENLIKQYLIEVRKGIT